MQKNKFLTKPASSAIHKNIFSSSSSSLSSLQWMCMRKGQINEGLVPSYVCYSRHCNNNKGTHNAVVKDVCFCEKKEET